MFEASLVDDAARTARPYTVSLSLALQVVAAAAAVAYPLLHIEALPIVKLRALSPFQRAMKLVDPKPAQSQARPMSAPSHPVFHLPVLPARADLALTSTTALDSLPQLEADPGVAGPFVPGAIPGDALGGMLTAAPPPRPAAPAERARPAAATPSVPVRPGGRVQAPQLLREVKPLYPALARQTRTQGTVRIEAIIARDGTVRDARVVSGHPLLVAAALDAVRQWHYRPTILNDQPVEVALALEVNFMLSR